MDALDYLIEAAKTHPEITIEVHPYDVQIIGGMGGAVGVKKMPWHIIRMCRVNPILPLIEDLRADLEAAAKVVET